MRKYIFLLVAGWLMCLFSMQAQLVRIGFIGNSITIGTGLTSPQTECYPSQIGLLLTQKYGDTCEIRNFAVSGRTMLRKGDYPIWNEPDFQRALNYAPDILFVMLGTNDSKPQNWDAYGNEFFADYKAMLDTFRWRNPHVKFIVCLPPPAFDIVWGIRDSVINNYVIPLVDSIATLYNALLIDFRTPLLDSVTLFPDKIHPNAQGARAMAKIAFDRIVEADIIHQVDTGYTFVTSCDPKPTGELRRGDTAIISYTTLRAQKVYFNGQEVEPNGSIKVAPLTDTQYVIKAVGALNEDSIVYVQKVYVPVLTRVVAVPTKSSFFPGDTIILYARYYDQKKARMDDTTFALNWIIKQGKGRLFDATDNQISLVADSSGTMIVTCQTDSGLSYDLKLTVRTPVAVNAPAYENLEIYPNPVNNWLNVRINAMRDQTIQISIFSLDGKKQLSVLRSIGHGNNSLHIDVGHLPAGVYLCKMTLNNQIRVQKFYINR
ncbi:MAG TPA: GDSL-type esterase/lipase family protein [Bacteroidales bacterium]|nr:GDSL-type esterase/lipase family protein [Bacteroidales bacterium]